MFSTKKYFGINNNEKTYKTYNVEINGCIYLAMTRKQADDMVIRMTRGNKKLAKVWGFEKNGSKNLVYTKNEHIHRT